MTVTAVNYAKVLKELSVSEKSIQDTREIFREVRELTESLENPLVPFESKSRIIDRVIPEDMKNFVKVVCKHHETGLLKEIFEDYDELCRKQAGITKAVMWPCQSRSSLKASKHFCAVNFRCRKPK